MNHLWNIIKKELRELLTPSTILPMVFIIVIFAAMGPLMSNSIEEATRPQEIGLMDADTTASPDGMDYSDLAVGWIEDSYDDPARYVKMIDPAIRNDGDLIAKAMRDNNVRLLLIIEDGYNGNIGNGVQGNISAYWYQMDLGGIVDMSEVAASSIINMVSQKTSEELIKSSTGGTEEKAQFIRNPVAHAQDDNYIILATGVFQGVTPSQISSSLMMQNMFISIVMMLIIIMIGSILVSSMGNEKENKTLETLLTLPVSRTTVVGGKIIGSAIVGLIFGAVYIVGMYFMMGSAGNIGGVDLSELGLGLGIADWVIVGAFLFMAIVCALGICMILGAFAKNYKAAQTLIMPITILAIVPMILSIFGSFSTLPGFLQAVMFAIPFSHPMMVMENLMFDNTMMIVGGFAYLAVFALVTLFITVRLYKSDILLTGLILKKSKTGPWKRSERQN